MRSILIAILLMSSVYAYPQCEGDIKAFGMSTNLKGLTLEITHVAQDTRVGFILGSTLYIKKEPAYKYVYNEKDGKNEYVQDGNLLLLKGSIHVYGSYKIVHRYYQYSFHLLGGMVYDEEKGIYPSGGVEWRLPLVSKCVFVRGLYPLDFRTGVLFQL